MVRQLPEQFIERLKTIIPADDFSRVLATFSEPAMFSVRVNTLRVERSAFLAELSQAGINFFPLPWNDGFFVITNAEEKREELAKFLEKGELYRQGLSSLLPVVVLAPQKDEKVLDMCAAPGSKTTQIAAVMENTGQITALETVRSRYYRLKSVAELLGAGNIEFCCCDARRYRMGQESFDRVLVDAPCSSEGRFKISDPKTFAYWSLRKIKEMVRKQRGLLLSAARMLKPGGVLVYSTCSFAPEENEGVVDWLLRKMPREITLVPIEIQGVATYPALLSWQGKEFNSTVKNCLRVLPGGGMEGFFLAKFQKI